MKINTAQCRNCDRLLINFGGEWQHATWYPLLRHPGGCVYVWPRPPFTVDRLSVEVLAPLLVKELSEAEKVELIELLSAARP